MAGKGRSHSPAPQRSFLRDSAIIISHHLSANWKAIALIGAVMAVSFYAHVWTRKVGQVSRSIEHAATLVRLTQVQSEAGGLGIIYFVRLDDGRVVSIRSAYNLFFQVGATVPVIEMKTNDGGTLYKFKDR